MPPPSFSATPGEHRAVRTGQSFTRITGTEGLGRARPAHSGTTGLAAAGWIQQGDRCNLLRAYYVLQFCKGGILQVSRETVSNMEQVAEPGEVCAPSRAARPPVKTQMSSVLNQFSITSTALPLSSPISSHTSKLFLERVKVFLPTSFQGRPISSR